MLALFPFSNRGKHVSMWTFPPMSFTAVRTTKLRIHNMSSVSFLIKVLDSGSVRSSFD